MTSEPSNPNSTAYGQSYSNPSPNDFVPAVKEEFPFSFSEFEVSLIANALADAVARSWLFDPKGTINDDVMASYGVLKLLKKINRSLSPDKRIGCVVEKYLPFEGGDIYINALYRLDTTGKGKVIAVATFSYDKDIIAFKLFDPVRYPNAQSLASCLGEKVPLNDIQSIQEVNRLTNTEMEDFCNAIKAAWGSHY